MIKIGNDKYIDFGDLAYNLKIGKDKNLKIAYEYTEPNSFIDRVLKEDDLYEESVIILKEIKNDILSIYDFIDNNELIIRKNKLRDREDERIYFPESKDHIYIDRFNFSYCVELVRKDGRFESKWLASYANLKLLFKFLVKKIYRENGKGLTDLGSWKESRWKVENSIDDLLKMIEDYDVGEDD